jgi:sugar lactone lactonase YvrE
MKLFASLNWWNGTRAALIYAAVMSGAALQAQPLLITTVAGYAGEGSTDGVGSGALFVNPQGVAIDAAGNVYVADTGNNTIRMITSAGVSSTLAGLAGQSGSADGTGAIARFNQPAGIALDAATNIYVCDYGNSTIRLVTLAGQVTTIAGKAGVTGSGNATGTNATFFNPMGIAADSGTNLYVADYGNHIIRKITPAFAVSTPAGTAGAFGFTNATGSAAAFYEPEAVAVDTSGNVYVADTGNAAIRKVTSGGSVTTFAGLPGSLGSLDGTGTNALFYQPAGIAIDTAGNLYVSDYFNNIIRQVTPGAAVTTIAGLAGTTGSTDGMSGSARFSNPQGVAVSGTGPIYVADSGNGSIRVVTMAGTVSTFAGSPSAGSANGATASARFYNPRNVAVDTSSNIYVADTQNSVIRKITPLGAVSVLAGSSGVFGSADGSGGSALFSGPQGIAVDVGGNLYVADTGNNTVRKITSGGSVSTLAGYAGFAGNADGTGTNAHFYSPEGVAVDAAGNVYVTDTWNHTLRKITSGGVTTTVAGLAGTYGASDGTNTLARFNFPTGVALDSSTNIYVTDFNNNTVRKVTRAGVVTTLAGWPGIWGNADGTGTNALFSGPAGISVDGSGNLYVADSGNQTLRKVVISGTNGTVSTVAGLGGVSGSADGTGTAAQFYYPAGVTVSGAGYVYVADSGNNTIRSQGIPPMIITQPVSQTNQTGSSVLFSVTATGSMPFTYFWQFNGTNFAPGGSSSLMASNAGTYLVTVSNIAGIAISSNATLTLTNGSSGQGGPGTFSGIARQLGNGTVQLNLTGTAGATYTLEYATNLPTTNWIPLTTFTMTNGAVQYLDTNTSNAPRRYYLLISP